jgi:hypothetical protein
MLDVAEMGLLFRPPDSVKKEFAQFRVCSEYAQVSGYIEEYLRKGRKK